MRKVGFLLLRQSTIRQKQEKAKELIDSKIDVISVSVESHDEETHDNIRF